MASTPIPSGKKDQVLAVVKTHSCNDYPYVKQNLTSYDDGLRILLEFSKTFDCQPTYLEELLSIFDDSELTAIGIYYNKDGVTINNPYLVVKCTDSEVNIDADFTGFQTQIQDGSLINKMTVLSKNLVLISISGNSIVTKLTINNSTIGGVIVKACVNETMGNATTTTARLDKLEEINGGTVYNVFADSPAIFRGYECVDET